jgi:hypothetical protein
MLFSEEVAVNPRKCHFCGRYIKTDEICWREYQYRDWRNICILCIGKVIKGYVDDMEKILKRITIKRTGNEEQKDSNRISTTISV